MNLAYRDAAFHLRQVRAPEPGLLGEIALPGDSSADSGYDAWVALPRRLHVPIRATLTVLMVGVVVLEGILSRYGMAASDVVLLALIPLVGGAVYGDTVRPAGMAPQSKAKPLDP